MNSASVGSVKVLSGDEASAGEDDVLDSANEADVSQGSMSLLDISTTDDEDTRKHKARELARKSDTDFAAWKDKLISEGVKGIQEQDSMVNDYTDSGKRKPKNPDPLGPPPHFLHERTQGISAPTLHDESFGVMSLLLCRPIEHIYANISKTTGHGRTCQESPAPCENAVTAVYHHCVPRWPHYCIGAVARTAYVEHTGPHSNLLV